MTKRTIEAFAKVAAKQAEIDEASLYLGCTCSKPECGLTWIVCRMPQSMQVITALSGKHKSCPNCGAGTPLVAKAMSIRALLGRSNGR